jgi:hypothetical protein
MGPQINIPAPEAATLTPTVTPLYFSKAYPRTTTDVVTVNPKPIPGRKKNKYHLRMV